MCHPLALPGDGGGGRGYIKTVVDKAILPEQVAPEGELPADGYAQRLAQLSRMSVDKHYDAFADIPWDDPAYALDPEDPRWEFSPRTMGRSRWYQSQPPALRARMGLYYLASVMKAGVLFENVLQRGMLTLASRLPNKDPTFRYAYHEVIEEGHHSLMFQEFVNRSGVDVPGLSLGQRLAAEAVLGVGRFFPEVFFYFVLGGECPLDELQRSILLDPHERPPLLVTLFRHHVTEEARHLAFAYAWLDRLLPTVSWPRRQLSALLAPLVLGTMVGSSVAVNGIVEAFNIPESALDEGYRDNPELRHGARRAFRRVREVLRAHGCIPAWAVPLWKHFGIWEEPA